MSRALSPPTLGLTLELWQVLAVLPYDLRCRLYEAWFASSSSSSGGASGRGGERAKAAEELWAEAEIRHATKKLLKRISSDKKKLKQDARSVARLAHSAPLVVLEAMLNNAVAYDNQIAPLVECCSFMTPFALDCASFMMVQQTLSARAHTRFAMPRTGHATNFSSPKWLVLRN